MQESIQGIQQKIAQPKTSGFMMISIFFNLEFNHYILHTKRLYRTVVHNIKPNIRKCNYVPPIVYKALNNHPKLISWIVARASKVLKIACFFIF